MKIKKATAQQWFVSDWRDVTEFTPENGAVCEDDRALVIMAAMGTPSIVARLEWTGGGAATRRAARLVLVRNGNPNPIVEINELGRNGVRFIEASWPLLPGDKIKLQVRAWGAQQASCMIQRATSGFFGLFAKPGTYIEVK